MISCDLLKSDQNGNGKGASFVIQTARPFRLFREKQIRSNYAGMLVFGGRGLVVRGGGGLGVGADKCLELLEFRNVQVGDGPESHSAVAPVEKIKSTVNGS